MTSDLPLWTEAIIEDSEYQTQELSAERLRLEDVLSRVCHVIKSTFGFDYAAIQLIRPEENFIETVYGSGIAEDWCGRAKHYMETDPDLRDIQADVAKTGHIEIISGNDARFDSWIFERYNHSRLTRVFMPLTMFQDKNGVPCKDCLKALKWEVIPVKQEQGGKRSVIRIDPHLDVDVSIIGTLEAGYEDSNKIIEIEQALAIYKFASECAFDVGKILLPHGLQVLAKKAKDVLGADSATLHFLFDKIQEEYIYQAFSDIASQRLLEIGSIFSQALDDKEIYENKTKIIQSPQDCEELGWHNSKIVEKGIQSVLVFPILVKHSKELSGIKETTGALCLYFTQEQQITEDEISQGQRFANRIADAIWDITTYRQMRDQTRQLRILHALANSLAQIPEHGDLLKYIAQNALNVLAADVVTIYEYLEAEHRFLTPPAVAGKLKVAQKMRTEIGEHDIPFKLIERNEAVYVTHIDKEPLFRVPKGSPFSERERVESVAGILLKVGREVVGTLFVNYRHPHHFSDEEKHLIDILASSAAISVKNQRWLSTISEIDREIISTLDQSKLLTLIAQKSVQITVADIGEIRLLDLGAEELVMLARYPENAPVDEKWNRTSIKGEGQGITGWVAVNRQSRIVDDALEDPIYVSFFPGARSELCVPLLDKDAGLLGVLNVESKSAHAFSERDKRRLEALANQVVIAIKKVQSNDQRVAAERVAALNLIARSVFHRLNNHLGAIQMWAKRISDHGDEYSRELARKIRCQAAGALEDRKRMKSWLDTLEAVDIKQIILTARRRISLPSNVKIKEDYRFSSEDLPKVMGSQDQLEDVFYNLLQNAIDAMPRGGELSVNTMPMPTPQDDQVWLVVQVMDTGIGIPKESLDKIFNPEYTTKENHDGEGLWITKTYIERLGGQLTVDSHVNSGSKFTVVFPGCDIGST